MNVDPIDSSQSGQGVPGMAKPVAEACQRLAEHLLLRQDAIVDAWRQATQEIPAVAGAAAIPMSQFIDDIPRMLAAIGHRLRIGNEGAADDAADAHGRQRWSLGYSLSHVVDELVRLQLCVVDEVVEFEALEPCFGVRVLGHARKIVIGTFGQMIAESASSFAEMYKREAEAHATALQLAMERVTELENERSRLWSDVSHDLRGTLGVVVSATEGLGMRATESDQTRDRFLQLLRRNVDTLHSLLDDLLSLTRLQAGRELGKVRSFDVAPAIARVAQRAQAGSDRLDVVCDGPSPLTMKLDPAWFDEIIKRCVNHLARVDSGSIRIGIRWRLTDDEQPQLRIEFDISAQKPRNAPAGAPVRRTSRVVEDLSVLSLRRLADLGSTRIEFPEGGADEGRRRSLALQLPRVHAEDGGKLR